MLVRTTVDDDRLELILHLSRTAAGALQGLHHSHAVSFFFHFTKDDVFAVEPGGLYGGDEKLGAVPETRVSLFIRSSYTEGVVPAHVFGPALAMERRPARVCLRLKFSSANFSP